MHRLDRLRARATWTSTRGAALPAAQQPNWPDPAALREVADTLAAAAAAGRRRRGRPAARAGSAQVARGEAFLLQGGDCAETFATSSQADIAGKVRVLLQMAVVLTYGASMPVVKLGRIAGQYAKPRSTDLDAHRAAVLPRRHGQRAARRRPHPGPAAASCGPTRPPPSTLNLLRAYAGGGWPSLEQVHAWNTAFARTTETGSAVRAAGRRDRPRGAVHARLRRARRRAGGRRAVRQPRGADPRVRAGADPGRGRPRLRPVRPLRLGRRAHPADWTARTSTSSPGSPTRSA